MVQMFYILIVVLHMNYCYANYNHNFNDYGWNRWNNYPIRSPDNLFGSLGNPYGSYDSYGSYYDSFDNYGSNQELNGAHHVSNYPSRKKNRKRSRPKNNGRTHTDFASSFNYHPSESYSNPQIYSNLNSYSGKSIQSQQMESMLPLLISLAKQLSSNQPVIQNFVNPSLPTSNSYEQNYKSSQVLSDRFGDSNKKKSRNKNKLKVGKIVMEDFSLDKKA